MSAHTAATHSAMTPIRAAVTKTSLELIAYDQDVLPTGKGCLSAADSATYAGT